MRVQFKINYVNLVTGDSSHLTGVYSSRQIASTQHSIGDQFFTKGAFTSALRQQGHLGLHHYVSRWTIYSI